DAGAGSAPASKGSRSQQSGASPQARCPAGPVSVKRRGNSLRVPGLRRRWVRPLRRLRRRLLPGTPLAIVLVEVERGVGIGLGGAPTGELGLAQDLVPRLVEDLVKLVVGVAFLERLRL